MQNEEVGGKMVVQNSESINRECVGLPVKNDTITKLFSWKLNGLIKISIEPTCYSKYIKMTCKLNLSSGGAQTCRNINSRKEKLDCARSESSIIAMQSRRISMGNNWMWQKAMWWETMTLLIPHAISHLWPTREWANWRDRDEQRRKWKTSSQVERSRSTSSAKN